MIDLHKMKVLIVDDMENAAKSIRGMLKVLEYGSTFFFASNGREGWNVLRKNSVDLAIIDWNMPVMTGIELLEKIRENRELRDMPVIMVTAEASRDIVAEAAESDIDAYLLKPLTVKSLEDKINEVVDKANFPSEATLLLKESRELAESGQFDEAIQGAFRAIKMDPGSSRPVRMLAYFYFLRGDFENAKHYFLKAAGMNPLDVFAFHHLGEIHLKEGDVEEAATYYYKAMSISPRHISRGVNFGRVLLANKNHSMAVKVFEKVLSLSGGRYQLKKEIAEDLFQAGQYKPCIKLFSQILDRFPDNMELMNKAAICYQKTGEHSKALPYFIQCEKMDQKNIDIKLSIAKSHIAMGRTYVAEESLAKILRMDPGNQEALELRRQNI